MPELWEKAWALARVLVSSPLSLRKRSANRFPVFAESSDLALPKQQIALVLHIFYPEYVSRFVLSVRALPRGIAIFITTPSAEIASSIRRELMLVGIYPVIAICENRGRNFGAMLVELGATLLKFDLVIHLHSKKSLHSPRSLARKWFSRGETLLLNPDLVGRALRILADHRDVNLIYPFVEDIIRSHNFTWGASLDSVLQSKYSALLSTDILRKTDRLSFPAGGMFIARVEAIRRILEVPVDYQDFPTERGQLDGSLHHGVERLIGHESRQNSGMHLAYESESDTFRISG